MEKTINVTYDNLSWFGEDKEQLHALNLIIENVKYGDVIVNIYSNTIGIALNKYIVDNNLTLPIEETGPRNHKYTDEELFKIIQTAITKLLDDKAKEKNYDDAVSCCSYYNSSIEGFRTEAQKFSKWRDAVWSVCYDLIDKYQTKEIERPTLDDVLNKLPTFEW